MFLHIDIDCFFASAERSVDAGLKGIPMAVGSRSNLEIFNKARTNIKLIDNNSGAFVAPVFYSKKKKSFQEHFIDTIEGQEKIRGIITTSSYEARAFGVKTAMPIAHALQLCPQMRVIPSNYPLYHTLSHKIHLFMCKEMPKVEQFSIDEFFADVSGWVKDDEVYAFAQNLQKKVLQIFDIPVSIGISKAKWIAKLATETAKPYGIYEVKDIDAYIQNIPIKAFPGIGHAFQEKLSKHYIKTLGEIGENKALFYGWKKPGKQLYHRVTGTDNEQILHKGERKSIGISRTFDALTEEKEVLRRIMIMARHITYIVMSLNVNPTTFYLKINYVTARHAKKSKTELRIFSEQLFKNNLHMMHEEIKQPFNGAVKLTLNVSNFSASQQKTLSLLDLNDDLKKHRFSQEIQKLREKFGLDIIKTGDEL